MNDIESIPYHDKGAEDAVLGGIINGDLKIEDALLHLPTADYFYIPINQLVYRCLIKLHEEGVSIDIVTCVAMLKRVNPDKRQRLQETIVDAAFAYQKVFYYPDHLEIVSKAYRCRKVEEQARKMLALSRVGDLHAATECVDPISKLRFFPNGTVHSFAELKFDDIQWLWPGWLANGFVTMVVASSGVGKSHVVLRICESFIRGIPFPDGHTLKPEEKGKVLWCEAENGQFENWRRVTRLGLPMSGFLTPGSAMDNVDLDNPLDKASIEQLAFSPDVKLIVLDSLSSAQLGVDENKNTGKGGSMKGIHWLSELAKRSNKPLIVIHHLRKNHEEGDLKPDIVSVSRIRGGTGIVQHCRIIAGVSRYDPKPYGEGEREVRTLHVVKINIAAPPKPIQLYIEDVVTVAQTNIVQTASSSPVVENSSRLLQEMLKSGAITQAEVKRQFELHPIPWSSVEQAKKQLGVIVNKTSEDYMWALPSASLDESRATQGD